MILFLFAASLLLAQPRAPEVFGQIGRVRVGGDEGSLGSGTTYGGAAMLPLTARWAVDVDVQTSRVGWEQSTGERFARRTTHISPAIVHRWGTARFYGFAGGGLGAEVASTRSRFFASEQPGAPARLIDQSGSESGPALLGKLGFVAGITERLLVRADLSLNFRYVLPSVGARIGIGYRF